MVEDAISFWTDIQRYEDMLAADPNSYCFAPLSELYRKLGLLDDAISVAQKGCDLHPDYPGGFLALGNAYHAKGLAKEAKQALERTVSLTPDNLQALKLLGQLYVESGEVLRAQTVLQQVLRQNPDDLESSLLLNSVTLQSGAAQPQEALEEVEVIEELTELLEDEECSGAFEEVEEPEQWQAPASQPPQPQDAPQQQAERDPLTTATLAELYVTQGYLGKALAIYQQLVVEQPGNRSYPARVAELKELQERQREAEQQAQQGTPQQAPQQAAPAPGAAAMAAPELRAAASGGQAALGELPDFASELGIWLENIRRRRHGA